MPELPEVETMCRGIAGVVGRRIQRVEHASCACRPISIAPSLDGLRRQAEGATVAEVRRVGKRVVLVLDPEGYLVFEPRMTGLVLLADPPSQEHLRLTLHFATDRQSTARTKLRTGVRLMFWDRRGLGTVQLLSAADFANQLGSGRIGPDALEVEWQQLRERFAHSSRSIKVALLDQKCLAGVGNLYAAEILHVAKVHPQQSCDSLKPAQWKRVHAALREVLLEAIHYEGSTLGDGTYRNALNQSGSYQNHHRVYGREGETCPTCGKGLVERFVQAQRATFFCPRCQRLPRPRTKLSATASISR